MYQDFALDDVRDANERVSTVPRSFFSQVVNEFALATIIGPGQSRQHCG
jgi:hypothetical protein